MSPFSVLDEDSDYFIDKVREKLLEKYGQLDEEQAKKLLGFKYIEENEAIKGLEAHQELKAYTLNDMISIIFTYMALRFQYPTLDKKEAAKLLGCREHTISQRKSDINVILNGSQNEKKEERKTRPIEDFMKEVTNYTANESGQSLLDRLNEIKEKLG